jgi:hypothetical protein
VPTHSKVGGPLKTQTLRFLTERPGVLVSYHDIMAAFDVDKTQAMNALSSVKRDMDDRSPGALERVMAGVYQWNGGEAATSPDDVIFTVIKTVSETRRLVEGENGELFVISKLEV